MAKTFMRKKQACQIYDISFTTLRRWVLAGLVKTDLDGLLVCSQDIEKAMTRQKVKNGRPFGKTTV